MKERLNHISFLQFVGPILVILGHSTNGMPSNNAYYVFTKVWIYVFHMPLFFFISGYMFSYNKGLENKPYGKFILGKFQRLLIPYLVWNALFIIPKAFVSNLIVDKVEFRLSYLTDLIITPRANILGHTWFLAALFLLFTVAPVFNALLQIKRNDVLVWSVVTVILAVWYIFPANTQVMALSDLSRDTLFFWVGIILGQASLDRLKAVVLKPVIIIAVFIATAVLTVVRLVITDLSIVTMATCFFTIMTLFIIPVVFNIKSGFIDKMGKRSFGIYIMHWPVMLAHRIVLYQILHLNSNLVIFFMAVCGFVVPNCIIWVLQRFRFKKIDKPLRYLLGL